jgi:hypothetical protein
MVSKWMTGVQLKSDSIDTDEGKEPLRLTYNYLPQQAKVEVDANRRTGDWYNQQGVTGNTPVELTRLASRVQLKSIKLNFREDLAGSSFMLDSVYLANVRSTTKLLPSAGSYETETASYLTGVLPAAGDDLIASGAVLDESMKQPYGTNGLKIPAEHTGTNVFTFLEEDDEPAYVFRRYVFENQTPDNLSDTTRMIIAGRVITKDSVDRGLRYYQVDIKKNDILERNTIYDVSLTIGGLGSDTPGKQMDVALVSAEVTVKAWEIIEHVENITDTP